MENQKAPKDGSRMVHNYGKEVGSPHIGIVFVEAKIRHDSLQQTPDDEIWNMLHKTLCSEYTKDMYLTLLEELLESEAYKDLFPDFILSEVLSLKAVEYVGGELLSSSIPFKRVRIEINAFRLCCNMGRPGYDTILQEQGEIMQLPSSRLEGVWERLFFDKDIRGNLLRLMVNMLKFSRMMSKISRRGRMNRLLLLSGAPGTGKTTLSQALAQKLSIRLNQIYTETNLIQINAATLLSKFFSESAKYIIQIFSAIEKICQENPDHLICLLIDEIESLASSRAAASHRGELQDGIRATNALLTGFDRVKLQANLIILCTSNMVETLDAAFLDRCGRHIIVERPSIAAQYHILREGVEDLISGGIVSGEQTIPSYRDAQLALLSEPKKPGSMLISLCQLLDSSDTNSPLTSSKCSARFLGQLPEVALADRLISNSCTLDEALQHMINFTTEQNIHQQRPGTNIPGVLLPGVKRKLEE